jgi:hypothetical protein
VRKLSLSLLVLGLGFLTYLIWHVGPLELAKDVRAVGWGIAALILAEGLANLAHTLGWRHCISRRGPPVPIWRLFSVALAGFASNYLLPMAAVGGEATKAAVLAKTRPAPDAFSSVLLDKLSTAIAHLLLAMLGAALVVWSAELPANLLAAMALTTLVLAGGMAGFFLVQRYGKMGALLRWLTDRHLGGDLVRQAAQKVSEVDAALTRFYSERPLDFVISVVWHLLGHAVALFHAWIFLEVLHQPAAFLPIACAGLLSLWFDLLTFAVPLNLGALEGSRMIALKTLGANASMGMAFGVSVRIAQLFWVACGLLSHLLFAIRRPWATPATGSSLAPYSRL